MNNEQNQRMEELNNTIVSELTAIEAMDPQAYNEDTTDLALATDESNGLSGKAIAVIGTVATAAVTGLIIGGKKLKKAHDAKKAEKQRQADIIAKYDAGALIEVVTPEEPKQETTAEEPVEVEVEIEPEQKKETNKKK